MMALLLVMGMCLFMGVCMGYRIARPQWKEDIKEAIMDVLKGITNRVEKIWLRQL